MKRFLFFTVLYLFGNATVFAALSSEELADLKYCAMRGDADALYRLALIYERGIDVPADKKRATEYYRYAAKNAKHKPSLERLKELGVSTDGANSVLGKPYVADLGNGVKMEFMPIPAGTFTMGSPSSEQGREPDESQVRVTLSAFSLGKTEVTQAQWKAVMGNNPSCFRGDNLPVERVSWDEAMSFCGELTSRERSAGRLSANMKFTLPTEAQWEYACRAGTTTRFYTGDDLSRAGWWNSNAGSKTHPVGRKVANRWGLYDMHGNVWEWCSDWYARFLTGGTNPKGASSGSSRVFRGGGWCHPAQFCRSADRSFNSPGNRFNGLGFRVALVQSSNPADKNAKHKPSLERLKELGVSTDDNAAVRGKSYVADLGGGVSMEFLPIPAGTFTMGSPSSEQDRGSDESQVRVTLSAFSLGKTEVTQAQWKAVMGNNPSYFEGDNLPVESVSWYEAMRFCEKLTSRERSAGRLSANMKFTLPTEAQWEYACRAGTTTRFYTGNSEDDLLRAGWCAGIETHPVGQKVANRWGLYDMHGNVLEWCSDWYASSLTGGTNPKGASSGSLRVRRGGGWGLPAQDCRSANRLYNSPGNRLLDLGFRVAIVPADS